MGKILLIISFALFLELNTLSAALKLDENYTRCAEACLKINPYENTSKNERFGSKSHFVKHCAKLTADGKCECDWEKVLTDSGDCICRNPRHKINENNQCVCDLSLCEAPMTNCKGKISEKKDPFGCCPQYYCNVCPSDSYPSNYTRDESCLCYPCTSSNCKDTQTTVVIRKGTTQPGTCCDLYRCEEINQNKTCHSNGKIYSNGETWLQDDCAIYRCENGIIFNDLLEGCEDKYLCFSKDNVYAHEQTWMEDECTNCTCVKGQKKCMAHFCAELPSATIKPPQFIDNNNNDDDCPSLASCKKSCAFGFKLNRRGCEVCKCKLPEPWLVHEILRVVNCTLESCELSHVLPSNCTATNNGSSEQHPQCSESYSQLLPAILVGIIVFLVVMLAAVSVLWYRERRRGDCTLTMHHHQSPSPEHKYIHIPMFDANLNTEKPILCTGKKPNVELKDFR